MQQVAEKFCSRAAPKKKTNQLNIPEIRPVVGAEKFSLFPSADFAAKNPATLAPYLVPTLAEDFGWFFRRCKFISIKIKMAEQTFYFYRRRLPDPIFEVRIFFGKHTRMRNARLYMQQRKVRTHTETHNSSWGKVLRAVLVTSFGFSTAEKTTPPPASSNSGAFS